VKTAGRSRLGSGQSREAGAITRLLGLWL
jgi:hypothetical protein